MNQYLLLAGIVIVACVLLHRFAEKLPVPSLLIFIALGMFFGENGPLGIVFNEYAISENICSACLIVVMFYGGFGTNVHVAKPVAGRAFFLASAGVFLTAAFVGIFSHYVLGLSWMESFLIGAVLSSTDAASVFNILRSQKMALKDHTDSLLELESGSNDPMSYLLTVVMVSLVTGQQVSVPVLFLQQMIFGVLGGLLVGWVSVLLLNRFDFSMEQGKTIFVFAAAIIAYALPNAVGGNGYLSVYLCGILMGNRYFPGKRELVHFFDAVTGISQMMIFFLLGLLVTPVELPQVLLPAILIMVFMTVIGRPLAVSAILLPLRSSLRQIGIVSWAGLRGVASIVFAIYVILHQVNMTFNIFNLVFCVVLLSLGLQGTLLPWVAGKLGMIDQCADIQKTFNDYQEDSNISFVKIHVDEGSGMAHKKLSKLSLPTGFLIVVIIRGEENIIPNGETEVLPGDLLVAAAREFENRRNLYLYEISIDKGHKWSGKTLKELNTGKGLLVVLVKRHDETIIPDGNTEICMGDTLVLAKF